ncbi:hypothetical protein [Luteolibacter sp. Populi]|uniref:hypothetical protein n=1 Tax=Luteolibacter sp. Populi TaxID=3230487 RepID=UPI00346560C8
MEGRHPQEAWDEAWSDVARQWIARIRDALPEGYSIHESSTFILLARSDREKAAEVLLYLEQVNTKIRSVIPALLPQILYGKCPVLVFARQQDFYEYVSMYMDEEGSFGAMGGVFLNRGYGHFAMPSPDLSRYAGVFTHELCHSYLSHLGLPLWLDEAITAGVEQSVEGSNPYHLDREMIRRHQNYWTEEKVAAFWRGESFYAHDEGQELSYHLARFILNGLHGGGRVPRQAMEEFFQNARYEDAGQSAALEILGVSLGDCMITLLGEGDYDPSLPGENEDDTSPCPVK